MDERPSAPTDQPTPDTALDTGPDTAPDVASDFASDAVSLHLEGRTALVTGAGSGIGRATALRLARAGAHVRCWDITPDAVEEVAALTGGSAEVVDLSRLDALDRLDLDADVVVNCAGIQHVAPVHEFPTETFS